MIEILIQFWIGASLLLLPFLLMLLSGDNEDRSGSSTGDTPSD
jgi:hypothetical protein